MSGCIVQRGIVSHTSEAATVAILLIDVRLYCGVEQNPVYSDQTPSNVWEQDYRHRLAI